MASTPAAFRAASSRAPLVVTTAQASLGAGVDAMDVRLAAERRDEGICLLRGERIAELRLDAGLCRRLDRRGRLDLVGLRTCVLEILSDLGLQRPSACRRSPACRRPPRRLRRRRAPSACRALALAGSVSLTRRRVMHASRLTMLLRPPNARTSCSANSSPACRCPATASSTLRGPASSG